MTEYAERMDRIVQAAVPGLREAGFRKRRHAFNRDTESGLVHVIDFQMGRHDPPGTQAIPPWRAEPYGWFTINVGVYLAEVATGLVGLPAHGFVAEASCEIRTRVGQLVDPEGREDLWYSLAPGTEVVVSETVVRVVRESVLPFLDQLSSRRAIVEAWRTGWLADFLPPRGALAVAVVLAQLGDLDEARDLTRDYLAQSDHGPTHRVWAAERAGRLGLI